MSEFGVVFAIVFAVYWLIPWQTGRVWLLLGASFYLYASWNHWLTLIVAVSTTFDFFLAREIERCVNERRRRWLAAFSITANLGLLCYFKYVNFFLGSLQDSLRLAGISAAIPTLNVLLPVGISFFTFEAVSYTLDVFQRKIRAEKSLPHFMLFITFFPHLIAGPIVRTAEFLPQIGRPRAWHWSRIRIGLEFCILGLIKKLAIADRMAQFVDPVVSNPGDYSSAAVWVATIAYTIQIFCDFSGYSDLAVGTAYLLGYKLPFNFQTPYLSRNISEFWRRWHISLSSWLRDYVYIPLGGSRNGEFRTVAALLVTMTLAGLWHGAAWNFVLFGVIQGVLLIIHRMFRRSVANRPVWQRLLCSPAGNVTRVALTMFTIMISLTMFRAPNWSTFLTLTHRMFIPTTGSLPPMPLAGFYLAVALMAAGHLYASTNWTRRIVRYVPAPIGGIACACALLIAMLLAPDAGKAFIYFQF